MTMMRKLIKNEKKEKNDVCIICLDDRTVERPLKLFDAIYQLNFFTICSCSCDVHKTCMKSWMNVSPKCPICRIILKKYDFNHEIQYWINPPLNRRRPLNAENAKKMIMIMLTIPVYLGMHLCIFYVSTYAIVKIICSVIV